MLDWLRVSFRPGWPIWRGLKKEDSWLIVWTACMLALAALCIAITDLENPQTVEGWVGWGPLIVSGLVAYLSVSIALINRSLEKAKEAKTEWAEKAPSYHAAFGLLFIMLCTMAWIAFGDQVPAAGWPWQVDLGNSIQRDVYLGVTTSAFIPLIYGFHQVASTPDSSGSKNYFLHPEGPVGWKTLAGSFALIALIIGGAWAAGEQLFSMEQNFGLIVMTAVVGGFLAFIFMPHIGGVFGTTHGEERQAASAGIDFHPGYLVSGLDAAAVRLLAPISGATQSGWMLPQLILTMIFLPLSAMGYALPHPWGLVPIAIAAAIIFGLGRRWAWVEDDREKALRIQTTRSSQFRLGFANDLRDEALMGYAWLFILVPLSLRQIQMHFDLFEPVGGADAVLHSTGLLEWLKFFGTELAKGVPIVDWVDIYDVNQEEPFIPKGPAARHIVFVSRLVVDVVIIAALLQAFGILQRNRAQERLFEAGQIDFFDPFMERRILKRAYKTPGETGTPLTQRAREYFENHRAKSKSLDKGNHYYNTRRLNELYNDKDKEVRAVVQWLARDLLVGTVTERLQKLVTKYEKNPSLKREEIEWTRQFYRNFDDVIADARSAPLKNWKQRDSELLSQLLSLLSEEREYDLVRYRAYAQLGRFRALHAARALSARLVPSEETTKLPGISKEVLKNYAFKRQSRLPERTPAITSLINMKNSEPPPGPETLRYIEAVLEYVRKDGGNGSINI